eukprot:5121011-Lingulodinium_polyedra.AAC.1
MSGSPGPTSMTAGARHAEPFPSGQAGPAAAASFASSTSCLACAAGGRGEAPRRRRCPRPSGCRASRPGRGAGSRRPA